MAVPNPTERQHVVPKFYLKRFADQRLQLQALDLEHQRFGKPRHYKAMGFLKYFYAAKSGVPDELSQHVEAWLQQTESAVAPALQPIVDKILGLKPISEDDRYALSVFMSLLWLRSPAMRAQLNRMEEDMTKQLMRLYPTERLEHLSKKTGEKLSAEDQGKLREMIETGSYHVEFNNTHHLRFMTENLGFGGPGFANMFFAMKWKAYIATGKRRFITTDSPVVEWWLPRKFFYGPSFLERTKYFALTPEILLELSYPRGSKKLKRETLFEADDDTVMMFNMFLASRARAYAYSGDRTILADMLAGMSRPGRAERMYYDKFKRPWDEEHREHERAK
jgi:hypothetical protein